MSDPALALQKAIVAALKGATGAGNNVYDDVPGRKKGEAADKDGGPFPRITLGEGQTVGNFADCYDGSEVFLQIDVWTTTTGFPETKRIAGQVRSELHDADLQLDGHTLELLEFQDTVYSRDPDGKTRRARITLRALTQPAN